MLSAFNLSSISHSNIGVDIMLNFILCDDNPNILNKLEKTLNSILMQKNLPGQISYSTTQPDKLLNYIENNKYDVAILDIDLKSKITGMSLANIIRKNTKTVYIIFTTAHLEYSLLAYKYKTFDFLPKPVTSEKLEETITRLFEDISNNSRTFFKPNKKNFIINNNDVLFIQKQGKKSIFKTSTQDYALNKSFIDILEFLPQNFVRCHKSYIVNLNKISSIQCNNIIFFNENPNAQCYIGPKYKNQFTEVINYGNTTKLVECINN